MLKKDLEMLNNRLKIRISELDKESKTWKGLYHAKEREKEDLSKEYLNDSTNLEKEHEIEVKRLQYMIAKEKSKVHMLENEIKRKNSHIDLLMEK